HGDGRPSGQSGLPTRPPSNLGPGKGRVPGRRRGQFAPPAQNARAVENLAPSFPRSAWERTDQNAPRSHLVQSLRPHVMEVHHALQSHDRAVLSSAFPGRARERRASGMIVAANQMPWEDEYGEELAGTQLAT